MREWRSRLASQEVTSTFKAARFRNDVRQTPRSFSASLRHIGKPPRAPRAQSVPTHPDRPLNLSRSYVTFLQPLSVELHPWRRVFLCLQVSQRARAGSPGFSCLSQQRALTTRAAPLPGLSGREPARAAAARVTSQRVYTGGMAAGPPPGQAGGAFVGSFKTHLRTRKCTMQLRGNERSLIQPDRKCNSETRAAVVSDPGYREVQLTGVAGSMKTLFKHPFKLKQDSAGFNKEPVSPPPAQ